MMFIYIIIFTTRSINEGASSSTRFRSLEGESVIISPMKPGLRVRFGGRTLKAGPCAGGRRKPKYNIPKSTTTALPNFVPRTLFIIVVRFVCSLTLRRIWQCRRGNHPSHTPSTSTPTPAYFSRARMPFSARTAHE